VRRPSTVKLAGDEGFSSDPDLPRSAVARRCVSVADGHDEIISICVHCDRIQVEVCVISRATLMSGH
jgi:hypothetical protein